MNKQAADRIITEYLHKIYGFAVKKSYSYNEVEELCAEIIKEVYLSLLNAKEILNIEGYIWRISEHTYAKYVSSKKKQEGISIDGLPIPFFENFETDDPGDEIEKLRTEVAFLTEKRRRVVYRFYYENKPIASIAKEMGIPEGTVKWHLNKARIELKEGFFMERKIGKLGLAPIEAISYGHSGNPGNNNGPEFYLGDKINLNIVYSVYHKPRTKEEIAEELGMTLVYLEEKISFLEENGFLVKTKGNRYTTYVDFIMRNQDSAALWEEKTKAQLEIAKTLAKEYAPLVRNAIAGTKDIYIPSGNRELFDAAAIFYGVTNRCHIPISRDLSPYIIKTTAGGEFIATIELPQDACNFKPNIDPAFYWACGSMTRLSCKYPSVYAWSVDSRYDSRKGHWENNLLSDFESLYEFLTGMLTDTSANDEKFNRLHAREFLTKDNRVNIMIVKENYKTFFAKIPELDPAAKEKCAAKALEFASIEAKNYPPQMQDFIISWGVSNFIGNIVALMVLDELYGNGTFRPLTEQEKVTANLLMFSDTLPTV